MQTKAGWSYLLDPAIRDWFDIGYNGVPALRDRLFDVRPSDSDSEYSVGFGGVAAEVWNTFKNTGVVPSIDFDQGYKTTFTHDEFIAELPVRASLIEDNKHATVFDWAQTLGRSAGNKMEADAASPFNNHITAGFTGGDGQTLCSDSHPSSPAKSSSTQDNKFASMALSADNLETVRLAMSAFKDDAGNIAGVVPDLLLVPPALENTAKNICEAVGKVGSADNDINPQNGRFQYIMWPRLTGATTWFLIDSALMKQSLIWYDRVAPRVVRKVQDETVFATWIARMRYSYGWRDWRWVASGVA